MCSGNIDDLFGASPENDLFDDGLSGPFGKKGGMFSGGSGLFDDVNEDQDETHSVKVSARSVSYIQWRHLTPGLLLTRSECAHSASTIYNKYNDHITIHKSKAKGTYV